MTSPGRPVRSFVCIISQPDHSLVLQPYVLFLTCVSLLFQQSQLPHRPPGSPTALLHLCLCSCSHFHRVPPVQGFKSKNPGALSIKSLLLTFPPKKGLLCCYQNGNTVFSYIALKLDHRGILLGGNEREVQFTLATVCLSFSKGYLRGSARLSLAPGGEMGAETEQEAGDCACCRGNEHRQWCCCRLVLLSGREPPSFWMGGAEDRKI